MKEITAAEVQECLEKGEELHVIDVREDDEVAAGIIPGAMHIALGEIPERIDELIKEKAYIIVCRSGARSGRACEYLVSEGYDATNMVDGMLGWQGETES